ncbi:MAG: phosphate ABC transporter permease PstA [Gammaproteobacteria bacterium]|nr:phosphate ABC transporter permease PstA [Gammaproteobacteria bacterium]
MRGWFNSGAPWIWLNAAAVSASLIMVAGLLGLIALRGLGHFWPTDIVEMDYRKADDQIVRLIGEIRGHEDVPRERLVAAGVSVPGDSELVRRVQLKSGNRDVVGLDFNWVLGPDIIAERYPEDLVVIERREWGNFYGYLREVHENGINVTDTAPLWDVLNEHLGRARKIADEIRVIERDEIGAINYKLERLRLDQRRLELEGKADTEALARIAAQEAALQLQYESHQKRLIALYQDIQRDSVTVEIQDGRVVELPLSKVIHVLRPNAMGVGDKLLAYMKNVWAFISDDPREANTEGGIFPAIFGTVLMVILMSIFVTPFGVIAAVYLREYAKQGPITRIIRIAVNNLAGVPSIVYGVFGLGFFVYFLGGNIDQLFYPEAQPAPIFGTPGILWASLTLALLTVPVVIVATEEGLARIPSAIREGSLSLGATKAETLWRTVLPMASPAMMTGLILAVARAAGEVAPLMLVGVVKLAPTLPLDGNAPFLHLDRKFMHLGFHIYDVGFQSPNVEAARPVVYATALLLVLVIVALNITAISIRNHLREKYRALDN